MHQIAATGLETGLVACHRCDLLHRDIVIPEYSTASCARCGTVLAAPRTDALARVITLALTAMILMVAAVGFPFLELDSAGIHHRTSVLDAVFVFSQGLLVPLSLAVAALIVLIPTLRFAAIIYALWPLLQGRAPFRGARSSFRLAETLRPWSMAEIFVVGVVVALVKVAGLASISLGPAFWAFCALVVVTVLHDNVICRKTIWKLMERMAS